jgi:hypothetical protein
MPVLIASKFQDDVRREQEWREVELQAVLQRVGRALVVVPFEVVEDRHDMRPRLLDTSLEQHPR